ncbi:enoyl-CoA hydratase/isomerase family protein [Leucobacter sp. W1153]|uniref:enoyl-CoA hydratase/isomerase family protein n=1 Tax=unclassified Leucobacter TaxID=2621730 RepID=UPI003F3A3B86
MTDAVLLELDHGLARIILNRPHSLNAFNAEMAEEWARVTSEATSHDAVRAIIVCAEGRAFCAGGDVKAMAEMVDRGGQMTALARRINDGIRSLIESSIPVVAAAQGTTAGGGLGILLASDYAVTGMSSKIGSLYANVGLSPDLSVSALLGRAVGERRALRLTLQDRLLSAQEALDWGLTAEMVADEKVRERAEEIAEHWVRGAAHAYGQAKRLLRAAPERTFAEQLEDEALTIGRLSNAPEAEHRIAAFANR